MAEKDEKRKTLLDLFRQQPDTWLSLADIQQHLHYPERTLRHWLSDAVANAELQATGRTKGRRYRLATETEVSSPITCPATPSTNAGTLFSSHSTAIIASVRMPLYTRQPCSYKTQWLEAYIPNGSAYLSPEQLDILHSHGRRTHDEMPAGTYARKVYNRLLVDLSYNSSRLEGNTYSLADTEKLLLEGIPATGKLDEEKVMILNHREAIRFLIDGINRMEVSSENIRSLHYLLADGLVPPGMAGNLRDEGVRISSSTYMPLEGRSRLEPLLELIANTAAKILDPFEQSLFLLVHIAYLQGFIDVNKRTSRMSANIPLVRHNLVPLSFNDISKDDYASAMIAVYELNETAPLAELYVWSYIRSCERYSAAVESVGVDTLRVLHRARRRELITRIIRENRHGPDIEQLLQACLVELPVEERDKFAQDTRHDLANLSVQTIAGMGISQYELQRWLDDR